MNCVAVTCVLLICFTIQLESKMKKKGYRNGIGISPGPVIDWACENEELVLSCEGKRVLSIISADYGRLSSRICRTGNVSDTNCRIASSHQIVNERCSRFSNCTIPVSTKVFGDPCPSTSKYLEVKYECVKYPESVYACEGYAANLRCEKTERLSILNANYGRLSSKICTNGGLAYRENCRSTKSLEIVRKNCNTKRTCSIQASNDIFGDPCDSTYKYLEIHYECVKRFEIAYACELDTLKLYCNGTKQLSIIFTNFGRLSSDICVKSDKNISNMDCTDTSSSKIIRERCQGKSKCSVPVTVNIFGDPCPSIWRYLEVHYECVEYPMSAYACEDNLMHLFCRSNEELSIINANYGRLSDQICPYRSIYKETHANCISANSTQVVRDSCGGKRECTILPVDRVFGNPCLGVPKYLEVHYECRKTYITKLVCQFEFMNITCKADDVIQIIGAAYGRFLPDICPRGNKYEDKYHCASNISKEVLEKRCSGKHSCSLEADDKNFGGDPCLVHKYLTVDYKCVRKTMSFRTRDVLNHHRHHSDKSIIRKKSSHSTNHRLVRGF